MFIFFFFFKQKTAYEMRISDWSSDVCSSDLRAGGAIALKLVVLDEIDTRIEQPRHLYGSRLGIEPDARLDDRADHRATVDDRQRPRAYDAEMRDLEIGGASGWTAVTIARLESSTCTGKKNKHSHAKQNLMC